MKVECCFPDVELSVADEQCADLYESLTTDAPQLTVQRVRDDELAQDFGATLVIVLSAPSVVIVARELSKWLARRHDARLVLRRTDSTGGTREVTLNGPATARVERMVGEFFTDPQNR